MNCCGTAARLGRHPGASGECSCNLKQHGPKCRTGSVVFLRSMHGAMLLQRSNLRCQRNSIIWCSGCSHRPARLCEVNKRTPGKCGVKQLGKHALRIQASASDIHAALYPALATGSLATHMQFTPVHGLLGGLVLGVATLGKFAITGRVLGISGTIKGLLLGSFDSWRVLFLVGLAAGSYVAAGITPAAFDVLPVSFTVTRAVLGGLLVGVGAGAGNGCTSGHGICGNARLSARSMVFTLLFMASGMAVASFTQSAAAAGIAPTAAPLAWPADDMANAGALLVAVAVLAMLGLASVGQQFKDAPKAVSLVTELVAGGLFAFGLVYTGMVRPTKVLAFLSPTYPAWDLTLAFVMGGALLVALPGFQSILRGRLLSKPYCGDGFMLPAVQSIDAKLVVGGLLFGAGWGLTGMCPGPALVAAVAKPSQQVLAFVGSMLAGLWLEGALAALIAKPAAKVRPA